MGDHGDDGAAPPAPPARERLAIARLAEVQELGFVGRGAAAEVVRAQWRGRTFALKKVRRDAVHSQSQAERLLREKALLLRLDHPLVALLHCTLKDDAHLCFALELVDGESLDRALLGRGPLREEWARFIAAELVLALHYIHGAGVFHRDLKPRNILLDPRGHVRLVDFGFARGVDDRVHSVCGTRHYMSPECVRGEAQGPAVDFWALGVLVYELLVGHPPFWHEERAPLFDLILRASPDLAPLGAAARDLVARLLDKDPRARLGAAGARDVMAHAFFRGVDWAMPWPERLGLDAPFIGELTAAAIDPATDRALFGDF